MTTGTAIGRTALHWKLRLDPLDEFNRREGTVYERAGWHSGIGTYEIRLQAKNSAARNVGPGLLTFLLTKFLTHRDPPPHQKVRCRGCVKNKPALDGTGGHWAAQGSCVSQSRRRGPESRPAHFSSQDNMITGFSTSRYELIRGILAWNEPPRSPAEGRVYNGARRQL